MLNKQVQICSTQLKKQPKNLRMQLVIMSERQKTDRKCIINTISQWLSCFDVTSLSDEALPNSGGESGLTIPSSSSSTHTSEFSSSKVSSSDHTSSF